MSDNVFGILDAKINDGQLDNLKALMQEMVDGTQRDEPGANAYEWFVFDEGKSLHLHERYADSEAVMVHLSNFRQKYGQRFLAYLTPIRITMYGNPSDEVRTAFTAFTPIYLSLSAGFAR